MNSTNVSRAAVAIMLAGLLLGGVLLGTVIDAVMESSSRASAAPRTPSVSAAPSSRTLPEVDLVGEDFASLPRYPGSIRSGYALIDDNGYRLIAAEYLAAASAAEVRTFYQGVIADHGWERVDIDYRDGEWRYLLVNGADEALIQIEELAGLVEIDVQLSRPIDSQAPTLPDALAPTPPALLPPAAPAPPPGGDDEDDDSDGLDDDDSR